MGGSVMAPSLAAIHWPKYLPISFAMAITMLGKTTSPPVPPHYPHLSDCPGITGEPLQSYIFYGPVYYQKLKHMVPHLAFNAPPLSHARSLTKCMLVLAARRPLWRGNRQKVDQEMVDCDWGRWNGIAWLVMARLSCCWRDWWSVLTSLPRMSVRSVSLDLRCWILPRS